MNAELITAGVSGIVALGVAAVAAWGAVKAQRISTETQGRQAQAEERSNTENAAREAAQARALVEAKAYERARESYERIVKDLEAQLDRNQRTVQRVQDQLDRVLERLGQEQDVSNGLRNQVRAMQSQLTTLQEENERFKRTIVEHQQTAQVLQSDLERAGVRPTPGQSGST